MKIKVLASIFISTSFFATVVLINKKRKKQHGKFKQIGAFYHDKTKSHLVFHKILNTNSNRYNKYNKRKNFYPIIPTISYTDHKPGLNIDEEFKNELINVC
jgi:hypothetical protein